MKLPLAWLLDCLDLPAAAVSEALRAACLRAELTPSGQLAEDLGRVLTFAGFPCDAISQQGEDTVLELDVLANRPDGQCILGLAREVAALLRVPLNLPPCGLQEGPEPASAFAQVHVEEAALCPRYTARVIRGVTVGASPDWLQRRLAAMGLIPRNNIVDVTNYVMFELNQPLHAFDLDKLAGRRIVVRRARPGEPFTPLYDTLPPLTPETLVIADGERAVAIAGVIGGAGSEVTSDTRNLLLESAYFDPANTRRTCRRLKVGTDAAFRFERGIDLEAVPEASARAAHLILEIAGGTLAATVLDSNPHPRTPKEVTLRRARLDLIYGVKVPAADVRRILEALGCVVLGETAEAWTLRIPSWRRGDLEREIDLIEEVARIHGYNHVAAVTAMGARIPPRSAREVAADRTRELLASLGYFECVTDSLCDPRWPTLKLWTSQPPLALDPQSVMREDHAVLRPTLLTSLLDTARVNQDRRSGTVRVFECASVFLPVAGKAQPEEKPVLSLLDETGFTALADAVLRLPEALDLRGARLELRRPPAGQGPDFLTPETACRIFLLSAAGAAALKRGPEGRLEAAEGAPRASDAATPLGWLGVAAPPLAKAFDLKKAPALAELDLAALAAVPAAPRPYRPLPTQPEVVRDVALVVAESVAWGAIESFAAQYRAQEPLRDPDEPPRFLSAYRGKQTGAGKKSVAFSVVYRSAERSLTDEEVNAAHQRFVAELLKKFDAALRA